ncbi:DNA-binding transcription repressor [Entomortierella beljakovae]|nr:DNA-binding transcription repressor [Entomortierella beljakovae]
MTSSVTPRQPTIAGYHNGSSKKMRFSLSSLQSPSSNGTAHLTQRDIEALRRKGLLPIAVGAEQSSSATTSKTQTSHLSTTGSSRSTTPPLNAAPTTPTVTSEQTLCAKPPLPISARVAPLTASKSKNSKGASKHRSSKGDENSDMIIQFKERPLPAYHHGIIEDTCSHLHTGANSRRHSDSSSSLSLVSPTIRHPVPENTLALDSIRRASIATTSPVIPSPLGGRTVLYKASYAHTLLSLPSRTASAALNQEGDHIMNAVPTPEMNDFKFPAEENRSKTPTSPAMKPTMSPTIPHRSKRKSSIPMRSPTWDNAQDSSPGVVFRLPFGTPPLPSAPFRRANTPSAQPLATSPMNPLEEEGSVGGSTPPTSYPSPASSSRAPSASGPSLGIEAHDQPSIHFETPPSPANRSGLGIQVQESFSELGATHPLESSSLMSSVITANQPEPITFSEEDSSISIGDIIVAEQVSAAQRQASQPADSIETTENNSAETVSMPTPPLTSRVLSMRVMEPNSERHDNTHESQIRGSNVASPPTPFTPGPAFQPSSQTRVHGDSNSLSHISFELLRVSHETETKNQEDNVPNPAMELDQDCHSTCSQPTSTRDGDLDKEEDPSVLPLWAQRQNHIRRQSLIPRPELDFVKGSGILPPANRSLVTVGGAKILSYPVLISDMVHVALDELQAKGMALDGSDISEESEEDAEHIQHTAPKSAPKLGVRATRNVNIKTNNSKRKKGSNNAGKRRGSTLGAKSLAHSQGDEEYHSGEEYQEDLDGVNEQENQRYMSSQSKRRRISLLKQSGADAESSASFRPTSERYSSSGHRRWSSNNTRHSPSPSASPNMGVPSFRVGNRLGSPVELDGSYTYSNYIGDDGDAIMEEDGVVDIDDDDDNNQFRRFQDRQDNNHKSQQKDSSRRSHVPEHLRIPASEVDIAVQLTKEMMESTKKRPHKKEKLKVQQSQYNNQNGRPSLKTLKPLLDATMKADGAHHRVDDDDENDNDNEDEYDLDNQEITKPGGSPSKKSANNTDPNGAGPLKKTPKPKEGKMTTKRCEACGASETPCWRPGYTAHSALCNSCGLRYKKSNVFCAKVGCKYIPLKTEYAAMEAERLKAGRTHLLCHKCKGPVALPVPKE